MLGDDCARAFEQKSDRMLVGKITSHFASVFDLPAGEETLHFSGMRGEQPWSLGLVDMLQSGVGQNGQGIGIDHCRTRRLADDAQSPRLLSAAKPRTDADRVDREVENIGELFERTHHDLGNHRCGQQVIGVGQSAERNQSGPAPHGARRAEVRRAQCAARTGEQDGAPAHSLVRVESAGWPVAAQQGSGEQFVSAVGIRPEKVR